MLFAQLVVAANDAPLEQAPYAFDAIGMNVTANPFLSAMVNACVLAVPKSTAQKVGAESV